MVTVRVFVVNIANGLLLRLVVTMASAYLVNPNILRYFYLALLHREPAMQHRLSEADYDGTYALDPTSFFFYLLRLL